MKGIFIIYTAYNILLVCCKANAAGNSSIFARNLFQHVDSQSSTILSPLSIEQSLTVAYLGAVGNTADELAVVLNYAATPKNELFALLTDKWAPNSGYLVANSIFTRLSHPVRTEFQYTVERLFGSEVRGTNFDNAVRAADEINGWVKGRTNDRIQQIITPDVIVQDVQMILVNAIYFHGVWQHEFPRENTYRGKFYTGSEAIDVDFMRVKTRFRFNRFEEFGMSVIELPYQSSNMSMVVMLPAKMEQFVHFREQVFPKLDLKNVLDKMEMQRVEVTLPKFKIEKALKMNSILQKMGLATMFTDGANFQNIFDSLEPIKVSEIVHKAVIDVTESGVEAAAATEEVFISRCLPQCELMQADYPFIFFIKNGDDIIFIGQFLG